LSAILKSPLIWPPGWPRARYRSVSSFGSRANGVPVSVGLADIEDVIRLLQGRDLVVTSNLPLNKAGSFRADGGQPSDPGIAIYFRVLDAPRVIACDRWTRVGDNARAIAKHVEAIRGQARWGCGSLDQALGGYKLLTAAEAPKLWYEVVLELPPTASWADVERRRQALLMEHHPDRGGSHDNAAAISEAFENARRAFGRAS
jgi:hypothetical protein